MSNLSQWAADFKAHFESVEQTAEAFLAQHVPGMAEVAAKIDADPLVQVALSTVLPPEAKDMVAQWIKDLEQRFPAPAEAPAAVENMHAGEPDPTG